MTSFPKRRRSSGKGLRFWGWRKRKGQRGSRRPNWRVTRGEEEDAALADAEARGVPPRAFRARSISSRSSSSLGLRFCLSGAGFLGRGFLGFVVLV